MEVGQEGAGATDRAGDSQEEPTGEEKEVSTR